MEKGIYIGIDYGDRRTGVAVSDATGLIASRLTTVTGSTAKGMAEKITSLLKESEAIGIVVGYPLAPDGGSRGERCQAVDRFISQLEKRTTLPIHRQDERGSSQEAQEVVHAHGKKVTSARRKQGVLDQLSAAISLQRWLDKPPA